MNKKMNKKKYFVKEVFFCSGYLTIIFSTDPKCPTKFDRSSLKERTKATFNTRFQLAFTACGCVFKEITLVGSNQSNFFERAPACNKRMLKTTVSIQLKY
jgi:hypothetical protein